jgi:ankyrin repeat protein
MNPRPMSLAAMVFLVGCSTSKDPAGDPTGQALVEHFLTRPGCKSDWKDATTANDRLWVASRCGGVVAANEALQSGASVGYRRSYHQYSDATALDLAAVYGHDDVVSLLLRSGADPNSQNRTRYGPLHAAARSGNVSIAQRLVDAKTDVNLQTDDGLTPLHVAMTWGNGGVARTLLAAGAHPNVRDRNGRTPMHMMGWRTKVFDRNYQDAADVLLIGGGEPNALNKDGLTPLDYMIRADNVECVIPLMKRGFQMRGVSWISVVQIAVRERQADVSDLALSRIDPRSTVDERGNTLAHAAANVSSEMLLRKALSGGGDINARNKAGETPLHIAARSTQAMVLPLLEAGAVTDIKNNRGQRPIDTLQGLMGTRPRGEWPSSYQSALEQLERTEQERKSR